ncbi:MAG: HAD family hydrolase [Oscillospiraceae bacterium]|nr:HAD family hydrolase [Oscillospiraceae bacterium]
MNIQIIVTDLDRTLLRSDKSISPYTAQVLNRCRAAGIKLVFATARPENACKRSVNTICPDAIVSNGGALARVGDEVVYRAAMDIETTNALLQQCQLQPSTGYITVETDKGFFVNKPVDKNDPGWADFRPAHHMDFKLGLDCEAYKIVVEIADATTAYALASDFPTVHVTSFSGEDWVQFADRAATKWNAIHHLAERWDIPTANIIAFGDDWNDIEMLRHCGVGVAVANALPQAKVAADFICARNDEDGVAQWLDKHVLQEDNP